MTEAIQWPYVSILDPSAHDFCETFKELNGRDPMPHEVFQAGVSTGLSQAATGTRVYLTRDQHSELNAVRDKNCIHAAGCRHDSERMARCSHRFCIDSIPPITRGVFDT
jgi:hypothetical protein